MSEKKGKTRFFKCFNLLRHIDGYIEMENQQIGNSLCGWCGWGAFLSKKFLRQQNSIHMVLIMMIQKTFDITVEFL